MICPHVHPLAKALDSLRVGESTDTVVLSSAIADRPPSVPPTDVERDSYFRRLSNLPPSTICKSIPQSLLTLVDAARGIWFAVSQVYQTLQHYTVYAIDELLSAILLKVLDPASDYSCRSSTPSIVLIQQADDSFLRHRMSSSRVGMRYRFIGVLTLQLKVLATRDAIRYTRQLLS